MDENEEGDQDDGDAGSNLSENMGNDQGSEVSWGRPRPNFEDLLSSSDDDDDMEAEAPNGGSNEAEDHPIVEQVVLFGEIANAVVDPDGLVNAINN